MNKLRMKFTEPLEKDIQSSILEYLRAKRVYCWKENSAGIWRGDGKGYIPSQLKGKADILGLLASGRFLAIEVKRKSGVLSNDQVEFIRNINLNGGLAFVATSIDDVVRQGI